MALGRRERIGEKINSEAWDYAEAEMLPQLNGSGLTATPKYE